MSAARVERRFAAYGLTVALRIDGEALERTGLDPSFPGLPPGWRPDPEPSAGDAEVTYRLGAGSSNGRSPTYVLEADDGPVAKGADVSRLLRAFVAHAERLVAERSPAYLFVHAGVVGWKDHAVLLPGHSLAGKTTLVRAFLQAGATYYSDEYAVLDRAGRVHPYARPLAIRGESGQPRRHVPADVLDAPSGDDALPVGLVLVTTYCPGARWQPRRLTAARALLALMRHAVAAQGSPAHSMPILKRVACRARALASARGEAAQMVADVVSRLGDRRRDEPRSKQLQGSS